MLEENEITILPSVLSRIGVLLRHPRDFMESWYFDASAWFPLLALTILMTTFSYLFVPEMVKHYQDPEFVKSLAAKSNVTEEKAVEEAKRLADVAPAMAFIEGPIAVIGGAAGAALMLYLVARFRFRQKPRVATIFNLVSWTSLVSMFPLAIQIIYQIVGIDSVAPTNLGFLFDKGAEKTYLYGILVSIDAFLIWQVWLLGLGLAVILKESLQKTLSAVGTLFVVMIAFNAGFYALGSK